jgi:hypothetical protein
MKRLPYWKLKREAKRVVHKMSGLPGVVWEYLFLRPLYDRKASREMVVYPGAKTITSEMAIYLVYAPDGLLGSHKDMLTQLAAEEIAPVVVSNMPLSQADREMLLAESALVIERPNVGYDFGGYRDAILQLAPYMVSLNQLFILNDSIWMVEAPQSWFSQVRAAGCDFVGATSNYGIKRADVDNFRDLTWTYTVDHPNFHYASFALAIGPRILRDPKFLQFWQQFRISNDKKRTVRRGEIGLTQWVLSRGYTHTCTCDVLGLDRELEAIDNATLHEIACNLVIPEDPRLERKRVEVLNSDPDTAEGRQDRIQIILMTVVRQAMGYSMPFYTRRYRGFQFLKKSPLWLSRNSSDTMLEILAQLHGPMGRQAVQEARELRRRKGYHLGARPEDDA